MPVNSLFEVWLDSWNTQKQWTWFLENSEMQPWKTGKETKWNNVGEKEEKEKGWCKF